MSQYKLAQEIISVSEANNWDEAHLEWELFNIYEEDGFETCLCGHYPIKELCVLKNKLNSLRVTVGNCCVQKFMGISSNKLFSALKRVKKDPGKPFNADVIEFVYSKSYINGWERDFYIDTWRKRDLSSKQLDTRVKINKKILSMLKK